MRARTTILATLLALVACEPAPPPATDAGPDADAPAACSRDEDCDDGRACNGVERCEQGTCAAGEPLRCDDGESCTTDVCVEPVGCVHYPEDADGDGSPSIACGGNDCDDDDPTRYPGAREVCDPEGRDEDCDPTTFGARDADHDGYFDAACCNTGPGGERFCGDDCIDWSPLAHPGEAEECDGIDNDCDGLVDENVTAPFYVDADGDGFGAMGTEPVWACRRPAGYAPNADDCDDADRRANPGLPEVCDPDGRDDDCDGVANPPERCACTGEEVRPCPLPGACAAGVERCIAGAFGECTISPQPERCDGEVDEDCDGLVDEGLRIRCWVDRDGDGYPSADAAELSSCPVGGRASVGGCPQGRTNRDPATGLVDCDDRSITTSPLARERIDGVDNDCDGAIDEDVS